ncbi:MAG: alpha/beta fold hydrolase [Flavobacteriaceae bacterium]|nr:alpha/beta fold hydrolase [Flavobacteriaceae bacterium]
MRNVKKVVLGIIAGILIIISMLYYLQEKLIFLPTKLEDQYRYSFTEPFEEFFISRPDGARLNALHFKREDPRGVILYFHGNAGNLDRWGNEVLGLVRRNYDLVIMDYRTYGKSSGRLSEGALLEDAQAFYDYISAIYAPDEIVLYGRSLGTAMASYLSSRNTVSTLILETPFYSLVDVAKERFPILPVDRLMKYPFKTHLYLQETNCPIIILQGDEDRVVPISSALKLYRSLEGKHRTFIKFEGGRHNNLSTFEDYQRVLDELLVHNKD